MVPPAFVTVSVTVKLPGVTNIFVGICRDDELPSPNDQLHVVGEPVDWSINVTFKGAAPVRGGDPKKDATGGIGFTVKRSVPIPDCSALFVTRTFHKPVAAPARLKEQVT